MLIKSVSAALILAGLATAANAAVYSTKASFDAAVTTVDDVTFGGIAPAGDYVTVSNPYAIGNVSITSSANSVSSSSFFFGTPTDTYFVNAFGAPATFDFAAPVSAFGVTLANGFGGGGITATVFNGLALVGTFTFTVPDQTVFTGFFGLAGVGSVTSVTFAPLDDGFLLVSEVQSGVSGTVPEPATWGLMIVGFGMVGLSVRRRRTIAAS